VFVSWAHQWRSWPAGPQLQANGTPGRLADICGGYKANQDANSDQYPFSAEGLTSREWSTADGVIPGNCEKAAKPLKLKRFFGAQGRGV
jgi:hypothetical protein